ncbi:MAG: hypothetical protein R2769_16835 [Saprospiraceae bacterium]
MNRLVALFSSIILLVGLGCSNDLDLVSTYKDIPVIYAKLAVSDTAHYVRVEKAFLDPNTNAFVLAQRADSLYYDDAIVSLEKVSTGEKFTLERVDGNLEGYVRDSGLFAQSPNYLYKIKQSEIQLQENEAIKISVIRGENATETTATTTILPEMSLERPNGSPLNSWASQVIQWERNSEKTKIFDLEVIINIQEREANNPNGPVTTKTLVWKVATNITLDPQDNNVRVSYTIPGDNFYSFLANSLERTPVVRSLTGVIFRITGGSEEIETAYTVALANQGITGTQDPPVYSNVDGGRGVFASVSKLESVPFTLANNARDSLLNGRFTSGLGFQ